MDGFTAAAASGMRARLETLDLLANNLANASAPGFKVDREFYGTYLSADAAESPGNGTGSVMPVIEKQWTDYAQGSLTPTGNSLDVALKGKGFFVAISPSGPLLTRDGSFRLSSGGDLETQDGFKVRGQDGNPIQLDATKPVVITSEGEIRQDGQLAAQLDIVDKKAGTDLSKHGMNYYNFPQDGMAVAGADLQQGSLESSNFEPAESAVRLVTVLRQFEMLQRAVTLSTEMNRQVVEQVARVTS